MSASAAAAALYAARWCVFGLRYLAYAVYGCLALIGKPAARLAIAPFLACLAAFEWRGPLEHALMLWLSRLDMRRLPQTDYIVAGIVVLCLCVTFWAHRYRARRAAALAGGALRVTLKVALLAGVAGIIADAAGWPLPTLASLAALLPPLDRMTAGSVTIDGVTVGLPDMVLAVCVLVGACVFACLSKLLTLLLGAFPVVTRPLRPLKPLKATSRLIRPMRVRVVVPPLR